MMNRDIPSENGSRGEGGGELRGDSCCAQQTGMRLHVLVVEALLIATYSTWGWANTYTHRKILSVENLSRANSRSLSSLPFQLVPAHLAYECTSVRACE